MNNILQLMWGNNGTGGIGIWIRRIIILIVIMAAAQVVISTVALLVSTGVNAFTNFVRDSVSSITYALTSGDRVEALTKLCLWLLVILGIVKGFARR